jgi:hypothetical protein
MLPEGDGLPAGLCPRTEFPIWRLGLQAPPMQLSSAEEAGANGPQGIGTRNKAGGVMRAKQGIWASFILAAVVVWTGSLLAPARADEGMFPLSELGRLNLQAKGLQLRPDEVFNPQGIALVNGICKVNGCTGSFVSSQGLIVTNHHCAFDAIQKASTAERDLLAKGFLARNHAAEIPAPGYTVRITESYEDVSAAVLAVVTPEMSFTDRTKAIERRRKELEQAAEKANPGLRAEVAEMFTGKTYILFLYTFLRDIRLVFAPPAAVGVFGGENDNWEWPRHTGDFSFMRAYTAADGSSAAYSPDNVPYQPKRFVQVAPQGASEEDFVFILGYPGRTARHRTASFLRYEHQVRLPAIVDLYAWQIAEMNAAGAEDRSIAIKHAARTRSLANVEKRSRGQIQGLNRTTITADRAATEQKLQQYIDADSARQARYGRALAEIDAVYAEMTAAAPFEINIRELKSACRALAFGYAVYEAAVERAKPDLERESAYMDRNWEQTRQQLLLDVKDWHPPTDERMLAGMLERLASIPTARELPGLKEILSAGEVEAAARKLIRATSVGRPEFVETALQQDTAELAKSDDPVMRLVVELYPKYVELRDLDKAREGRLARAYGDLIDIKREFQAADFVPDANATLRLTYGYVRGYSPSDAIYKKPFTTLRGLIEKTTGEEPYVTPPEVLAAWRAGEFGRFVAPKLGQVPVALLYSTDTTGGNSGSPVLNSRGQLIGVNFDRTFEATINDFAWNADYSRSIGVDIRYVLWITGVVYGGDNLLSEMGVPSAK